MTALAADLTEHVIPFVPVRQFVLSVPHRLRYLLAYDHDRCIAVLRIFIRALLSFYRRRARKHGVHRGRTGSVTFLQRFGSAANLNLHSHVIVLDGVFTQAANGQLSFHAAEPPTEAELGRLLATIRARILRHLERQGLLDSDHGDNDPLHDQAPLLASCYASSIGGRQTLGRRRGAKRQRIGADPNAPWVDSRTPQHAQLEDFDLHAALTVPAQRQAAREPLEKLLRYCARPPIAQERLQELPNGRIALQLKTPWHDGSTHVVYEPLDLIAKLAALIPRPRKNIVLYHGVLSANAARRSRVVAYGRAQTTIGATNEATDAGLPAEDPLSESTPPRDESRQWADLMRRSFGHDLLACAKCGGKMKLLDIVLERSAIRQILTHLRLPSEPPAAARARASPEF